MTKDELHKKALIEAELKAIAYHTMSQVQRDETLKFDGIFKRLRERLIEIYQELGDNPELPLQDVNTWLALALFAEDRQAFLALCAQAELNNDAVYQRAQPWLKKIIEHDENAQSSSNA